MKSVLIIGGGASGITAAICLARSRADVHITVLEKNDRILKKLLSTGNGKCNITNTAVSPAVYDSAFAGELIASFDFAAIEAYLASLSLPIKADREGRCYPLSESAKNVVNTLLRETDRLGIEVHCGQAVERIWRQGDRVYAQAGTRYSADALIFAIGSAAAVKGYNGAALCRQLGWQFAPPTPALCPIPSDEAFLKELKGVRAKGSIRLGARKQRGEIQFAEHAVSGICAFNLAKYVRAGDILELDFAPEEIDKAALRRYLTAAANSARENAALLDFLLVRKLGTVLIKRAGLKPSASPQDLSAQDIENILAQITAFKVRVQPPRDFQKAQTVCGGVDARFADAATLAAKGQRGIFLCGEILDADAPCGGFNLHWAWASGIRAAQSAEQYLFGSKQ